MRTVRCSCRRGGGGMTGGWGCLPGGCLPGGCLTREGVSAHGGGGCLPREGCLPQCMLGYTKFLTHTCENITFLQLCLRMVVKFLAVEHYHIINNVLNSCN